MQPEFRDAVLDDLDQLIRLHDRELDAETLRALKSEGFPGGLALGPILKSLCSLTPICTRRWRACLRIRRLR